jgi:hypothetical protein
MNTVLGVAAFLTFCFVTVVAQAGAVFLYTAWWESDGLDAATIPQSTMDFVTWAAGAAVGAAAGWAVTKSGSQ